MKSQAKEVFWTGAGVAAGLLIYAVLQQTGVVGSVTGVAGRARAALPSL